MTIIRKNKDLGGLVISKSKNIWVSFGGRKQRASELSPELRKKLGIVIEDSKDEIEKIERVEVYKARGCSVKKKKVIERSEDSGMDIVMKGIGRGLGKGVGLTLKWLNMKSS